MIITLLWSCKDKEPADADQIVAGQFKYVSSSRSGVTFNNSLSPSEFFNIIAFPDFYQGGGVAIGDINNDGLPDLYFVSNQWDNKLYLNKGNFRFEDITASAGVSGSSNWESDVYILDVNGDKNPDIYVKGTKDILFINNGNLRFTGKEANIKLRERGIVDINNDGLEDIIRAGRFPYDERVLKTTAVENPNQLLINVGNDQYSEIAWYAGVAATDWSSTPLVADFDNDGLKDIFITTGAPGRANDLDWLKSVDSTKSAEENYSRIPSGAVPNFFFRQKADLKFEDVSERWIGKQPTMSGGAAYADLDNDGDLDIVVNNTNSEAFLLRNDLEIEKRTDSTTHVVPSRALLEATNLIKFKHNENSFNTLTRQPIIPFTNATRGPGMSVGDLNGDKLDDVFIGGGQGQPGVVYIQTKAGKFVQVPQPAFEVDKMCEETCSVFFDIDGDKDLDLMIGSGGEEFLDKRLLLRQYLNNGRGTFSKMDEIKRADIVNNLQKIYVNASVLIAADIDNDEDMDVFVGGGTVTGRYGVDSDSFILLNDGKGAFVENPMSFEDRQRPGGMVQAAAWANLYPDEYPDLVTAGEWMTISVWRNDSTVLKRQVVNGLDSTYGWWSSLAVDDFDGDGDLDIIGGNFGLNTRLQVSKNQPLNLVISDIDKNGRQDPLVFYYSKDLQSPLPSLDQLLKQVPAFARKFPRYSNYAGISVDVLVPTRKAIERQVYTLASTYFENVGNNSFVGRPLPTAAQLFPVLSIHVVDVNGDGTKDLMLAGNIDQVSPDVGSNSSGNGLILINNGKGEFKEMSPRESGFIVSGQSRDVKSLLNSQKQRLFLVTRSNDSLMVFKKK